MAIIPLGALTIPSIRKLLINIPGFPGGRFSRPDPPPLLSLPNSGAKGSRRTMFSRAATGLKAGAATGMGTSDFAAVTDVDFLDLAADLAAGETLLAEAAAGFLVLAVLKAGLVLRVGP